METWENGLDESSCRVEKPSEGVRRMGSHCPGLIWRSFSGWFDPVSIPRRWELDVTVVGSNNRWTALGEWGVSVPGDDFLWCPRFVRSDPKTREKRVNQQRLPGRKSA